MRETADAILALDENKAFADLLCAAYAVRDHSDRVDPVVDGIRAMFERLQRARLQAFNEGVEKAAQEARRCPDLGDLHYAHILALKKPEGE